jgi:hypothetical protein
MRSIHQLCMRHQHPLHHRAQHIHRAQNAHQSAVFQNQQAMNPVGIHDLVHISK